MTNYPTAKDLLRAARQYVEDPDKWCQHRWDDGHRRCAASALGEFWHQTNRAAYDRAMASLEAAMGIVPWVFNDGHTHAEVLAAMDRAIEIA